MEAGGAGDARSPFAVETDRLTTALALWTMTVGVTYTFRLTVTDVQGDSAYGEVKVTINAPPSSGSCALAPIKGWALMSDYTFRCVNWVDDDLPLGYEFRAQPGGATSRSPLADTQQDPSFTSLLPQGDSAYNYTVLALCRRAVELHGALKAPGASCDHLAARLAGAVRGGGGAPPWFTRELVAATAEGVARRRTDMKALRYS